MLQYPPINPTIFSVGPLEVRWYGLCYVVAFIIAHYFGKKMIAKSETKVTPEQYEDYLYVLMLGVIIGGRVGYILFYNLSFYFQNPIEILKFWHGGMSFHGGALGVIIAGLLFCRKHKIKFYQIADPMMPLVAIGLGIGRIGNFLNAELYGRPTNLPWGMIFPNSDGVPRHPSQIYESLLEGFLLSIVLFYLFNKKVRDGIVFWTFIGGYGIVRFLLEFVRQPDDHLGFVFMNFTQGQILSSVMVIASTIMITKILIKK